ncbi:MAG: hypothetical protein V1661_01560 [bacterium]
MPIKKNSIVKNIFFIPCLSAVVLIIALFTWGFIKDSTTWRAVFLANNQVYFGKFFYRPWFSAAKLKDIYYLDAAEPAQSQNPAGQNTLKLKKFGNEAHRPKDEMMISKSQILFWEDLAKDSPIIKAIKDGQK